MSFEYEICLFIFSGYKVHSFPNPTVQIGIVDLGFKAVKTKCFVQDFL